MSILVYEIAPPFPPFSMLNYDVYATFWTQKWKVQHWKWGEGGSFGSFFWFWRKIGQVLTTILSGSVWIYVSWNFTENDRIVPKHEWDEDMGESKIARKFRKISMRWRHFMTSWLFGRTTIIWRIMAILAHRLHFWHYFCQN